MRAHGGLQGFDRVAQIEDAGNKPVGERDVAQQPTPE